MSRTVSLLTATALLGLAACYHATIETGLPPGPQVIDQPWASGWVYGLVPPKTVETMAKCSSGVSKVETLHSFLNSLVGGLTFGIYTPITIKVTCAAGGRAAIPAGSPQIGLGANPTAESAEDALRRAVALALQTDVPVYIQH